VLENDDRVGGGAAESGVELAEARQRLHPTIMPEFTARFGAISATIRP
jgi:hypothetical protein